MADSNLTNEPIFKFSLMLLPCFDILINRHASRKHLIELGFIKQKALYNNALFSNTDCVFPTEFYRSRGPQDTFAAVL